MLSPRSTNAFFSARPPRGTPQKCPERSPLNVEFETPGASDRSFFLRRSPWSAGSLRDGLASVRRGGGRGARSRVHVDTAGAWGRQDGGGEVPTGITPPRSPARTPVCSDDDEDAREKSLLDHLRRWDSLSCLSACRPAATVPALQSASRGTCPRDMACRGVYRRNHTNRHPGRLAGTAVSRHAP